MNIATDPGPLKFGLTFNTPIALQYHAFKSGDMNPYQYSGTLGVLNTKPEYLATTWLDSRPLPPWNTLQDEWPEAYLWYYKLYYHLNFDKFSGDSMRVLYEKLHQEIQDSQYPQQGEEQPASSVVTTFPAGETISAMQAVYQDGGSVYRADSSDLDRSNCIGIAITAGNPGENIRILQYGLLEDTLFSYPPASLLFVTSNGIISDVAPTTGYLTRLGRAITATTALIIIDAPKAL